MKSPHILLLFILFAFFSTFSLFGQSIQGKYEVSSAPTAKSPPKANSLDKVKIVEVLSFSCSFCNIFNKEVRILKDKFGDKIEFIHYPLINTGPNPAKLYYLSVEKGKGARVKDFIYSAFHESGIRNINDPEILGYLAADQGLSEEFKTRINDPVLSQKIEKGLKYANDFRVRGTPTLIIEDSLIAGGDPQNLTLIINSLLKEPIKL